MKVFHEKTKKHFESLKVASQISNEIKSLATMTINCKSFTSSTRRIVKRTIKCPISYMRYGEFEAVLKDFELSSGMKVLDISSPQWFSIYLAKKYPKVHFCYINILESELEPYKEVASALDLKNLHYQKGDVRSLNFNDSSFDRVISISVIEHIYPEKEGDLMALNEIRRVLKSGGEFFLTIPYKDKSNIVYVNGPVHERNEIDRNFYAREYDDKMFNELVNKSKLSIMETWYILERKGLFSPDYNKWGPGKDNLMASIIMKSIDLFERLFNKTFDKIFAKKYLSVSKKITDRVVNISTKLHKA